MLNKSQLLIRLLLLLAHRIICQHSNQSSNNDDDNIAERIAENEDKDLLKIEEHNYTYYRHQYHQKSRWIELNDVKGHVANVLRESYLYGHPIILQDYFTFYGHRIREVLVTTGGFLYMDEMTHRQLTYSQYIAPLMANFETRSTNDTISTIKYFNNHTMLIIWWTNMKLRHVRGGNRFTFQLVYHSSGSIFFNYKKIPAETFKLLKTGDSYHKVAVGLSDAYYLFENSAGRAMNVRVVFEYHQFSIPIDNITKYPTIEIKPLPNCVEQKSCDSCTTAKISSKLDCLWCPSMGLCSDGFDRMRQKWLEHGCSDSGFVSAESCKMLEEDNGSRGHHNLTRLNSLNNQSEQKGLKDDDDGAGVKGDYGIKMSTLRDEIRFSGMLLGCGVFVSLVMWLLYAIKYPNSTSGRWLIEHRPSKLMESLRRGLRKRMGSSGGATTETYVSFNDREMNADMVL